MNTIDDTSKLTHLGSKGTEYKYDGPSSLEAFPNRFPERDYVIQLRFKEFTSLCPKTGQPDFGTIEIEYTPNELCLETKSLKLYFFAYRQVGTFMESIVNMILSDCIKACQPRRMSVKGTFKARGGIQNIIVADYFPETV